ncbi:Protein CASC3 [Gossypium australe]|uniref:Protein CASC3 n=1 Tax=Gossypium australe TaxID=47621 RepID=A0A5B6UEC8_9ROSI|nr:Protein CASC3 [Gossypium australe]
MATTGEEVEYESDPEEVKRSLAMRRREAASDDEDNNTEPRMDRKTVVHSDESDGQGEELDLEESYDEEEEEEEEIDEEGAEKGGKTVLQRNLDEIGEDLKEAVVRDVNWSYTDEEEVDVEINDNNDNHVEEKDEKGKENEPFAVPTAGAFYMHDDRFRENVGGRRRRTRGGRKLWESKDDRKWGHDKFEEMTLQEKHHQEGRSSRGRYRARSKNQGPDHGYPRGSRSKAFGKKNNQNQAPKSVRGRGPRKYEPTMKNSNQAPPTRNRSSGKPLERTSQAPSSGVFMHATNADAASVPSRKHVFASSLSSASPPFYPSGSSNKDVAVTQKDMQAGSMSRNLRPSVTDGNYSVSQSNSLRGKNALDSLNMAKLCIDDSRGSTSVKPLDNVQMLPSGSSLGNTGQLSQSRVQVRGTPIPGQKAYQSAPQQNQVNRVSPQMQVSAVQRSPVQGWAQSSIQAAVQQLGQHPGIGSQASSPPKTAMSVNSNESGEVDSSETSRSKDALVSKGKNSVQGAGRGSFMYGGAQIMGATGNITVHNGDQNFPAFLPVMQFGGQHPSGLSVPAVGMAFPGYVAQSQNGLGSSEMTWLPVLTGGAGALGTTFCPPYIPVDGAYHARSSGQTSSTGSSSKENTSSKPINEWKPSQKPGLFFKAFGDLQLLTRTTLAAICFWIL